MSNMSDVRVRISIVQTSKGVNGFIFTCHKATCAKKDKVSMPRLEKSNTMVVVSVTI